MVFGLVVATMLNAEFRGRNLVRTINLIPWAIPTIVAGLAFRWMFDDQYGLITDLLLRLTSHKYELLVHPFTARLCVILVNVWKNTPFMAVVLLAGLQSVPTELFQQGMLWFNWGMASALGVLLIIVVAIVGIIGLALFRHYDVSM